jgi:hypothetical protein
MFAGGAATPATAPDPAVGGSRLKGSTRERRLCQVQVEPDPEVSSIVAAAIPPSDDQCGTLNLLGSQP